MELHITDLEIIEETNLWQIIILKISQTIFKKDQSSEASELAKSISTVIFL